MEITSVSADLDLATEKETWHLIGSTVPDSAPQKFPILGTHFQIGRRADVHLCIPRPSVSKLHAELLNVDHCLFIRDLQSTNGTYVNGTRIQRDVPISEGDILQFADAEFRVGRTEPSSIHRTIASSPNEWQWAISSVNSLIHERQLIPFFQPIVDLRSCDVVGYEVLARSDLPGLQSPRDMFKAASLLGLEPKLSELAREMGVLAGEKITPPATLFLNTHPSEHDGQGLVESLQKLRDQKPNVPLVLELHEGAITDLGQMRQLRDELRRMEIRLAFDDFGAGQSRLVELAEIAPDYLKFDIGLIRGIHKSAPRQQLVGGILKLSRELGITSLAEGIEEEAEAQVCRQLGFALAQGYLFGRPASLEKWVNPRPQ